MGSKGEDIHAAARNGDLNAVELIISSNPLSINSRDKHSRTPLHLAAWAGHAHVVTALCKHKADAGAAAMDDMSAIHFAAQKGHLEVVKALVSAGVSVKATNRKGMTALHYAVQGSHIELTKYLLKKGTNLSTKTKAGKTVLDLANKEEIRSLLVEYEKAKQSDDQTNNSNKKPSVEDQIDIDKDTGALDQTDIDKDPGSEAPLEEKVKEDKSEEPNEENLKRKGDEDNARESSSKPKKSKVALNHLLTSDIQEDEEK